MQQLMREEPNAFLITERSENNLQRFQEDPSTEQTQESLGCSTPLAKGQAQLVQVKTELKGLAASVIVWVLFCLVL